MYWIGTDVLNALRQAEEGSPNPVLEIMARQSVNLAVASHLVVELRHIGIESKHVPFPGTSLVVPDSVSMPVGAMSVVSYVPDTRRDFYGLPTLLAAARELTDTRFKIFRGHGEGVEDAPPNIEFLGYVPDVGKLLEESNVFVRLVEHDGDSVTVGEALLHARPVVYTYEIPHTIYVPFGDVDGFVSVLQSLREQHQSGGIPLNVAGREWAIGAYDADWRFANLLDALLEE